MRGYCVETLEKKFCDGLEIFRCKDDQNSSTNYFSFIKKYMDIIGSALKYIFKDVIIPCILNTIVINNRLNKISRDLDEMGMEKNFLQYVNVNNYIYANKYNLTNKNRNYPMSYRTSSCSSNNSIYSDADLIKHSTLKHSTKKLTDNDSRLFYSKSRKLKNRNTKINKNDDSYERILQVLIRDNKNNHKKYRQINLPCVNLHLIHYIIELINSSSINSSIDDLDDEFIATLNDTCNIINEKLDDLDDATIKRCRLFCNKQNNNILIKLKMMNLDGSKIILYETQLNPWNNSGKILKPRNKFKSNKNSLKKAIPIININSRVIVANQFDDIQNKKHNSMHDQPSHGSIDKYSVQDSQSNNYKPGNLPRYNYYNNPEADNNDDEYNCSCSLHNFCNYDESCDSECSCELSVGNKGEESSEKEIAIDEELSYLSAETHQHEETQTNEMNFNKKELNNSKNRKQMLDKNIEKVVDADSISTQTSEVSEPLLSNISVVISDAMKNREVNEMERIEEEEVDDDKRWKLMKKEQVGDYEEMKEPEVIEAAYEDNEDLEVEIPEEIGDFLAIIKRNELGNVKKIDEEIIQIDDDVFMYIGNIVIELIIKLPMHMSSSLLKSSGNDLLVRPKKKNKKNLLTLPESNLKTLKQKKLKKKNSFHLNDKEDCRKSSSVLLCRCRHFDKSNSTSEIIKYSKKYSDNLSDEISHSKSFSNVKSKYGHTNLFASGDSSMNNCYLISPHKRRSYICYCKKNRAIKSNSKIHFIKRKINHYTPIINKNVKSIMSRLCKRLKIIFSKKTYRKLKKLIIEKKKAIKLSMERKKLNKASKIHCEKQYKRQNYNGINYSSINLCNKNLNNSQCDKNYLNNYDKLNHQRLSKKYCSMPEKSLKNYKKISTNHKIKLPNSHQRKQLLINDMKHREVYNKLINNVNQQCYCSCCCDSFETINYYESTDNSIIELDNQRCKFVTSIYKRTKKRESHETFNNKKLINTQFSSLSSSSSLSLSSRKNYFCYYHKMFAAKKLNEHSLNSHFIIHQSVSGELDVDCGECFGPDDHDFRVMLNQYINVCKPVKYPIIKQS
ncbi:hypothetical protein PV326_009062 [Microctonus aethiopoides]|nr:hypothetical protein PV326_009062 [Microctonus aethiopoides]